LGIPPKKKRTPFYWVSEYRRAISKWLQPLDFGYTSKKRRTPLFGIKNEEHHENVARFWVYLKKRRTPFYWVSKLRRAIRRWLQPLDLGYISKKRRTLFFGSQN
jgi:hypothetical protein